MFYDDGAMFASFMRIKGGDRVALSFLQKPDYKTLQKMKAQGFHWNALKQVWTMPIESFEKKQKDLSDLLQKPLMQNYEQGLKTFLDEGEEIKEAYRLLRDKKILDAYKKQLLEKYDHSFTIQDIKEILANPNYRKEFLETFTPKKDKG